MNDVISGSWNYPTQIKFGPGTINELAATCLSMNMKRPLLVTDEGLAEIDFIKTAISANEKAGVPTGLFADVKGNPVGRNITDGVAAYLAGNHDGIIAFGGGSGVDAGKAIALMAGQERPLWDFEDVGDNWTRVNVDGIAPIIAVPTTSGTGSEVGRASVILNEDSHEKKIIFHPRMLPQIVLADPELTLGLPPKITAATGIDAFVHCFEAYCAPGFHPMADGIALEGMRLIANALPRAYENGGDIIARAKMLSAAIMGATAFQKGLGGVHALAHPAGAIYDAHHGLVNAILLPYVMCANRKAIAPQMIRLGRFLGLDNPGFKTVFDWVLDFRKKLGIPNTLTEIGMEKAKAPLIGEMAKRDPSAGGNPIALEASDYAAIYSRACSGDLG